VLLHFELAQLKSVCASARDDVVSDE